MNGVSSPDPWGYAPRRDPAAALVYWPNEFRQTLLDQLRIDQLHAATLKASDSCFEMKKMCATLVVAAGTLVSVFTDKTLSRGVFVAGLAVVLTFWLADSVGYFYQRRLRSIMDGLIAARAKRCAAPYPFRPATAVAAWRAAFNGSMVFYLLLALFRCNLRYARAGELSS
jgi:hypothetical protein